MMNDILLNETTYASQMEEEVIPYLSLRREEHYTDREPGKSIYYVHYRTDAPSPKGVVVISHGFTESVKKYDEICYYFLKQGFSVFIPEHCGHGHSYRLTEDLSLVYVDDFKRYVLDLIHIAELARKEYTSLPLYGYAHSMGGGVAAAAASMRPELFQKLVLSSPMIRPQTGGIPWEMTKFLSAFFCLIGKGKDYVPGARPFDGKEQFADSASLSEARFLWYQKFKKQDPLYQTCAASYGWLHQAARLNRYLRNTAVKQLKCPVLLFQAELDSFVVPQEQDLFMEALAKRQIPSRLIRVKGAKHEIFNSNDQILAAYWNNVFDFFNGIPG